MSGLQVISSNSLVRTVANDVVHVKEIQVRFKGRRPKYPVSVLIEVDKEEHMSPVFGKYEQVAWRLDRRLSPDLMFSIIVREHHRFNRRRDIVTVTVSVIDMIMKPVFVVDEPDGKALSLNIQCAMAGPLVKLIRELVEEAQDQLSNVKTFLEQLGRVCEYLNCIADIVGPLVESHPAVQAAVSVATLLIEKCKRLQACHVAATTLMEDIANFLPFTEIPSERLKSSATTQIADSLLMMFEKIARAILKYSSDTILGCLLNDRTDEMNDYKEEFRRLKETFSWCVKTEAWKTVLRIETHTENLLLTLLRPVLTAFYVPEKSCFEGSRRDTLRIIEQWSASDFRLFWLTGPEGHGKSTIVHTVAQILDDESRLFGCFFCDGNAEDSGLRSPERIIPTIAYQLAKWHGGYRSIILDVLHGPRERSIHASLQSQFDFLIKEPLRKLSDVHGPSEHLPPTHAPLIITLDAVDECRDSEFSRRPLCEYIVDTATLIPWLKIIVTSRKSEDIERCFQRTQFQHCDIGDPSLDLHHDIAAYAKVCAHRAHVSSRRNLGLENAVGGLFSRISRSLLELGAIKSIDIFASKSDLCDVDAFYCALMRGVMEGEWHYGDKRLVVRDVLAVMSCLTLAKPPTVETLVSFLRSFWQCVPLKDLHNLVSGLSPVVTCDAGSDLLMLFPPVEFLEFMSDRRRSGPFWVDIEAMKSGLAQRCLDVMHMQLKLNICGLESSYLGNTAVPDLKDRVEACISGPLRYCCLEWMELIIQSRSEASPNLSESVQDLLCSSKALFWLEVLSLIGALEEGKDILLRSMGHFEENSNICGAAKGLYDFISIHQPALEVSTPHIYVSAYAWLAPDSSLAHRLSFPIARPRFALEGPVGRISMTDNIVSEKDISCIAHSPDGNRIVSGHGNGELKIWDGRTGEFVCGPLKGHTSVALFIAFSPDGARIVSVSRDHTLRVWDVVTGKNILGPLQSPKSSEVLVAAFSAPGNRIVSGHAGHGNGRLVVWDAHSGKVIVTPWIGETVRCVAYSPEGYRIVSGHWDKSLRIWGTNTGAPVGQPLRGHTGVVTCVTYSPDGTRIVSGSHDKTVRVWDARAGDPIGEPSKGHENWVLDIEHSWDGNRIYSSSWTEICVWDAKDGRLLNVVHRNERYWEPEKQCFVSIPSWWPEGKPLKIQSLVYSASPTTVPNDGWIRTLDGGLLLWVPPDHRRCRCHAVRGSTISPDEHDEHILRSELRRLPNGKGWTRIMPPARMS